MTLVYDHHVSDLGDKLTERQHSHHEAIVSTLHIHLDAHNCLEVVVLQGKVSQIQHLADGLIGTKGVKHGELRGDHHRRRSRLGGRRLRVHHRIRALPAGQDRPARNG